MDHANDLGPRVEEELLADLEDADLRTERAHHLLGLVARLDVERDDEPVLDRVGSWSEKRPAGAHRGPTRPAARAAASATGTSVASACARGFSSTLPRARARGPTVTR